MSFLFVMKFAKMVKVCVNFVFVYIFQFKKILIAYNNGQNFCVLRSEREQKYENKIVAEIIEYTDIRATYPSSNFLETQKNQMIIFFLKKNPVGNQFLFFDTELCF